MGRPVHQHQHAPGLEAPDARLGLGLGSGCHGQTRLQAEQVGHGLALTAFDVTLGQLHQLAGPGLARAVDHDFFQPVGHDGAVIDNAHRQLVRVLGREESAQ